MEQNQQQNQQNKQSQQQTFRCSGDCIKCPRVQREYCAAQKGYDNQQLLLSMTGKIEELAAKIASIQDSEAMVFATDVVQAGEPLDAGDDGTT